MSALNISFSEPMQAFVEEQVEAALYGSTSNDIHALVRKDQQHKVQERLEAKLLEALESHDFNVVTPELFERIRARVQRHAFGRDRDL
jgi:putative addiction module CopG family antidote